MEILSKLRNKKNNDIGGNGVGDSSSMRAAMYLNFNEPGARKVEITPTLAKELLSRQGKNRKINQSTVNRYAKDISEGKWILNGETIKFSVDGALIDGQHRLNAVIQSGMPILTFLVVVDNPDVFKTVDRGRNRTADQLLEMEGVKSSNKVAAVSRRLITWENTKNKQEFSLSRSIHRQINADAVLHYGKKYEQEILHVCNEISQSPPYKNCKAGSSLVTALIICKRIDVERGMFFIDKIKNGLNLTINSPIHQLREKLAFPPVRSNSLKWDTEVMALTFKSWNYFINGDSLKKLRWRQEGENPELFPIPKEVK